MQNTQVWLISWFREDNHATRLSHTRWRWLRVLGPQTRLCVQSFSPSIFPTPHRGHTVRCKRHINNTQACHRCTTWQQWGKWQLFWQPSGTCRHSQEKLLIRYLFRKKGTKPWHRLFVCNGSRVSGTKLNKFLWPTTKMPNNFCLELQNPDGLDYWSRVA